MIRRFVVVSVVAALVGLPAAPAMAQPPTPTPFQTPDTTGCPYKVIPPPPVDQSEAPLPGQAAPAPVPLPESVIGGERMAECGLVLPGGGPALPAELTAAAWLIADAETGAVLAAKDPHGRHRPASIIKVLTAMVVLNSLDPNQVVIGTEADANQEGSKVGIGPDGRYTVNQLLHGLLMRSGNDAAHALAVQLGGVAATVAAMNELARSVGALDTRASTPSGLDGPGTSTSAYDLALLFRLALRNLTFASIIGTRQIDFPGFRDKPGFIVANDNKLLANYRGALGGKTGFTGDARHTYAGVAERNGRQLLVVLLRGEQLPIRMWQQAGRLLDYGFQLPAQAKPVGQLVESAPAPAARPKPAPKSEPAAGGVPEAGVGPPPVGADPPPVATSSSQPSTPWRHGVVYLAGALLLAVATATGLLVRREAARYR